MVHRRDVQESISSNYYFNFMKKNVYESLHCIFVWAYVTIF